MTRSEAMQRAYDRGYAWWSSPPPPEHSFPYKHGAFVAAWWGGYDDAKRGRAPREGLAIKTLT